MEMSLGTTEEDLSSLPAPTSTSTPPTHPGVESSPDFLDEPDEFYEPVFFNGMPPIIVDHFNQDQHRCLLENYDSSSEGSRSESGIWVEVDNSLDDNFSQTNLSYQDLERLVQMTQAVHPQVENDAMCDTASSDTGETEDEDNISGHHDTAPNTTTCGAGIWTWLFWWLKSPNDRRRRRGVGAQRRCSILMSGSGSSSGGSSRRTSLDRLQHQNIQHKRLSRPNLDSLRHHKAHLEHRPSHVAMADQRWLRMVRQQTFLGAEMVDWMMRHLRHTQFWGVRDRKAATALCDGLLQCGFIKKTQGENRFLDHHAQFRFQKPLRIRLNGRAGRDSDRRLSREGRKGVRFTEQKIGKEGVVELSVRLLRHFVGLFECIGDEDPRHLQSRRYASRFSECRAIAALLPQVRLQAVPEEDRLAFFVNVCNALYMHTIIQHGQPLTLRSRISMCRTYCYTIGNADYSLLDIEYGILRAGLPASVSNYAGGPALFPPRFTSSDPRHRFRLRQPHPNVTFALCNGTKSSPEVTSILNGEEAERYLLSAAQLYIKQHVAFTFETKHNYPRLQVKLPELFMRCRTDFGRTEAKVLAAIADLHWDTVHRSVLADFIAARSFDVTATPWEWARDNSKFLSPSESLPVPPTITPQEND